MKESEKGKEYQKDEHFNLKSPDHVQIKRKIQN